uniref:Secreted protein n=1 Tax=Anguilla anguilla TaxID=7936 RepID=A0A0E9VZ28_ANGAN
MYFIGIICFCGLAQHTNCVYIYCEQIYGSKISGGQNVHITFMGLFYDCLCFHLRKAISLLKHPTGKM